MRRIPILVFTIGLVLAPALAQGGIGMSIEEVNRDVLYPNFRATDSIHAVSFSIKPQKGVTYAPGQFEQIQFDVVADEDSDTAPNVPPSPQVRRLDRFDLSADGQKLTFVLRKPIPAGGVESFRFQIERPMGVGFDVDSNVVPEPSAAAMLGLGCLLIGCRLQKKRS